MKSGTRRAGRPITIVFAACGIALVLHRAASLLAPYHAPPVRIPAAYFDRG
jgi:hypothetical protein